MNMKRVHGVVVHLEPAIRHNLQTVVERGPKTADVRAQFFIGSKILENVIALQNRFPFRRTHVSKQHSISLLDRIPWLSCYGAVTAVAGFARLKQTSSFHVELPPVVAACDSLLSGFSIEKSGAPVHAARIEQAGAPFFVPEQNQVFAKNAHVCRPMRYLRGETDGLPIAAHQLAARRPRPDLSQFVI